MIVKCVALEDLANLCAMFLVDDHNTPSIPTHGGVPVRRSSRKQPFLDPASKSVLDVQRLLLRVEAGHIGQRPSHHASGRRVLRGLRDVDHWQAIIDFQPLQFDIIEQIAGRTIDFEEEHASRRWAFFLA